MWQTALLVLLAYLLGSLPFPFLVTKRLTGLDIRYAGNGNMGVRNVARLAGRNAALLTLLLDAGKGALAYGIAHWLGAERGGIYLGGVAAVLGHWFPVWLRFRGGIGQAVMTGYLCAMFPIAALFAVPAFPLALRLVRVFNLAYAIAALIFIPLAIWQGGATVWDLAFMGGLLGAIVAKKLVDARRQEAILRKTSPDGAEDPPPP
jgi:glycerol-3-phosphate acyltransferase PlsY